MTTRRVFLLALVAIALSSPTALARQSISLDGEWECVFAAPGSPPPAEAAWEPVAVPSLRPWRLDGPHALWYRTGFYLPPAWAGQRIVLTLGGAKYGQQVFFNGKPIGQHVGGFEPTEYDVTDHAVLGTYNELLIAIQDWTCLLAAGAKAGPPDAGGEFGSWVHDSLVAPLGSEGGEVGIWGSVSVEARPRVWVADAFVAPSVREQMLRVHVTVKNAGLSQERTAVTARIAAGGVGPRFPPRAVTVPAGKEQVVTLEAPWADARLWSPEDPHLYSLVAGARTGAMGDAIEVEFGFREFWTEGDRFLLNGTPITLLTVAALPMADHDEDPSRAYQIAQSTGAVAMALRGQPWPSAWYEAADRAGMLLIAESALWHLAPSYALSAEAFWKNARDHVVAQVRALRNHPSVVIWAAEDELLYSGGARIPGVEQKVAELADLIHQADPTRPVMFEGDGDPGGKADIVNLHHPHELPTWTRWPEAAYWFDSPARLDHYPGTRWQWARSKPLFLGEFGQPASADVDSPSVLLGDAAYPDVSAARAQAQAALWEMMIVAARDAGVSGICPGSLWQSPNLPSPQSDALADAYHPLSAFVREAGSHAFAGTVVTRTLMVFNDTAEQRSLELRWALAATGGEWEATGSEAVLLAPAGRARVPASLALPASEADVTPATFTLELWEGGQRMFASSQPWKVYGRQALSGRIAPPLTRVAVYDPRGETTGLLSQLGIECLPINRENARRLLHFLPLAVVGKGAFAVGESDQQAITAELGAFVRAGGSLLVFEQDRYPAELIPLSLSDHDSTIAFSRAAQHPALAGLGPGDLVGWLPDGLVGRREIVKPARVGFLAIVDSGGARGLETAGLAELRVGKGRMLLCQLDLTSKFGLDPAATRILRNLVVYGSTPVAAPARVGVFCDDAAARQLDAIGLSYERLNWPLRKGALRHYQVLLVCNLEAGVSEPARLQEFVRDGGRVLLHGVTPARAAWVQRLLGQPLEASPLTRGAVSLNDRSGPAVGLSNQELAWFRSASPGVNAEPRLTTDIADHWLGEASEIATPISQALTPPIYHTLPGLLISSRLGRGLWVVDQVRWDRAWMNEAKAQRYLSTLLTNLGCESRAAMR